MSFGQTIKKLRKNANMTQEELAELLSISPQAISRWETDAAMPDISFLRPLSTIFGVTSDVLLEIDVLHIKESVEEYRKKITDLYNQHQYKKMLEVARTAHQEIPNNMDIVGLLAFSLTSGENEKNIKNIDEAILLYQLILEKSVDNILRFRATAALCRLYNEKKKNKEKSLFYAKQLPKGHIQTASYLIQRYDLLDDEDKNESYKNWIEQYTNALTETIYLLADPNGKNKKNDFTVEQKIELLEKQLQILKIVYGDKLLSVNREFYEINRIIGCLWILENQNELALDFLENAVDYAIAFDEYQDGDSYSSLMMKDMECDKHSLWEGKAVQDMLERLSTQSRYDCLREHFRFEAMINKLKRKL